MFPNSHSSLGPWKVLNLVGTRCQHFKVQRGRTRTVVHILGSSQCAAIGQLEEADAFGILAYTDNSTQQCSKAPSPIGGGCDMISKPLSHVSWKDQANSATGAHMCAQTGIQRKDDREKDTEREGEGDGEQERDRKSVTAGSH
jgi:hypothetical protein